jgi:hypothetical protein
VDGALPFQKTRPPHGLSRRTNNISGGFAAALNDPGLPRRYAPRNDGVSPALPWRIPLLLNGRDNEPNARDNAQSSNLRHCEDRQARDNPDGLGDVPTFPES